MYEKGSLCVIIRVLTNLPSTRYVTTMDLGAKINYSVSSIEQVTSRLMRDGFIESRRGPNGGYKRIKPLEDITIGNISHYVDERHEILYRALQLLADTPLMEFANNESI